MVMFMFQEEELWQKNKEREEKEDEEEEKAAEETEELTHKQRYEKLMVLLNKSKFYSEFLLKKMEAEDEETKKLKEQKLAERRGLNKAKKESKQKVLYIVT